jgi:hypothetical protein
MTGSAASIEPLDERELVAVASRPGFRRRQAMVAGTGGCADPIHPVGRATMVDGASGEVLHSYDTNDEPNRRLLVACRNRRTSRCGPCAEVYRADTYQLIRAGLAGGKNVPEAAAGHPRIFATLTAPSFGPVHHRVTNADGSVQPCHPGGGCKERHAAEDPCLGQAIDRKRYDYRGAVVWTALAGVLWHRTVTLVVRHLARHLGLTEKELRRRCRVSYGKVAEFQARGLVHFHVIIRLDGPDGPGQPSPEGLTVQVLTTALEAAVRQAAVTSPESTATGGPREVRWGEQLDSQPITAAGDGDGELTDQKVAGYVAKYATKAAESTGTLDRPVVCWRCKGTGHDLDGTGLCALCDGRGTCHDDVHHLVDNAHAQAMISSCWILGGRPELEGLRLRPWAHMLGFRGHFSTKSRCYSTTLTGLRQARQQWRNRRLVIGLGYSEAARVLRSTPRHEPVDPIEEETILVLGNWQYIGRGHSRGEAVFARTIATDLAENRRLARQAFRDPRTMWEGAT